MSVDKKIDKIVKKHLHTSGYISNLCSIFQDTEFYEQWSVFWFQINTKNNFFMTDYFNKYINSFEAGLLRLLVLEDFKLYLKQKGAK